MIVFDVYYDYVCPYVYRGAEWVDRLERALEGQVRANWRYFSLHQVNHPEKDTWKVWEQPLVDEGWQAQRYGPALRCFWGAEAARRQGDEAFRRFHLALLRARFEGNHDLADPNTVLEAARTAELDLARFEEDLADPSCLERLAADHTTAVSEHNVFGTPTFVFPGAKPAYLKLTRALTEEEALDFWEVFRSTVVDRPYVLEIKRPH